jgi:hypothetical protein
MTHRGSLGLVENVTVASTRPANRRREGADGTPHRGSRTARCYKLQLVSGAHRGFGSTMTADALAADRANAPASSTLTAAARIARAYARSPNIHAPLLASGRAPRRSGTLSRGPSRHAIHSGGMAASAAKWDRTGDLLLARPRKAAALIGKARVLDSSGSVIVRGDGEEWDAPECLRDGWLGAARGAFFT